MKTANIVDTKCSVVLLQDLGDFITDPALFTKLKGVAMIPGQSLEEFCQTLGIDTPGGRKLEEDWSKFFPQCFSARKKFVQRVLRVFQLFVVRKKSAGLYSKAKGRGSGIAPGVHRFKFGQHVEAVIDLYAVEALVVKGEHLRCRQLLRIELSQPVFVMPSRGPDADFCRQ